MHDDQHEQHGEATGDFDRTGRWLVAGWPGMGQVAAGAVAHLVQTLDVEPAGLVPEGEFFERDHVEVAGGVVRPGRLPRNMFFALEHPGDGPDLQLFLGERQPDSGGDLLCRRVMDMARVRGVDRVITFAASASTRDPALEPRVFAAVTDPGLLPAIREAGATPLKAGRIGGLNGVLLAAAAERDIPALCLLADVPAFAPAVPNPRAIAAVLEVFGRLADLEIDLGPLRAHAARIDPQLHAMHQQFLAQGGEGEDEFGGDDESDFLEGEHDLKPHLASEEEPEPVEIDPATRRRIEDLFEATRSDRSRARDLKEELDRLGLFDEYEDRFLDLFRNQG